MRYSAKWPVYAKQWDGMVIKPSRLPEFEGIAKKILASKARYQAIEAATGVKWYHIGVIHTRESNNNFSTYLGNGQSLSRVTTIVPKGRGPFATFEAGAVDALKLDGLTSVHDWRLEKILYYCELFNGAGYDARGLPSPYIWGGTSVQKPGKYVRDGVFDSSAMDTQPGCAPILATLAKIDPTIHFIRETPPNPAPSPVIVGPGPDAAVHFHGFCIRGLFSVFLSRAMENLAAEINVKYPGTMQVSDHGTWPFNFGNVGWLTDQCVAIHQAGKKIVLIGHSFGGTAAIMVAQALAAKGIPVELLCPIDPAAQYTTIITANVKHVVGFFQNTPGQLGQGVIEMGNGWTKDNWKQDAVEFHRNDTHLGIPDEPFVHNTILNAIRNTVAA